jgi:hypothetical protein
MNGANKLENYVTQGQKGFTMTKNSILFRAFVSYEENEGLWIQPKIFKIKIREIILTYKLRIYINLLDLPVACTIRVSQS